MKRFAILCSSLAILASMPVSAQTMVKPNTPTIGLSTNNTQMTNSQQLNNAVATPEELERQRKQAENEKAAFSKEDKMNDPSYVRRRIQELERALYNKTKKEVVAEQEKENVLPPSAIKTMEEEYKQQLQEKILEQEIKEKIEGEVGLKQFGKDFFDQGTQADTTLFADSAPSSYQLGPGDSLKIIVWSELGDETVYDVQVNPEGQVYIPIIGILGVSGKTVGQFESIVLGKLSGKFKHFKGQVTLSKVRTIMIYVAGEVEKPGAMMVSGLTTAFSALYQAGGPTDKGSMRNIRVIGQNGNTKNIDLYRYFMSGDRNQDIPVKNGDTIFVPPTEKKITVAGMVARPAIYELIGETGLVDVMKMAGNILPEGYSGRISVTRWAGSERRKSFDISPTDKKAMSSFKILPGDEIKVERSNGIVENSVTISGPVYKPGNYAANNGLTISGLVKLAGGLISETVNYDHGQIVRKTSGGKKEILSFSLRKALDGDSKNDIVLKPLDEIKLFEEKDISNEIREVYIGGAVRNGGKFEYHDGITVADLVLLANGLNNDASGDVEIARKGEGETSVILKANINKALSDKNSADNIVLQPLDKVNIVANGEIMLEPEVVVLKGQVMRPGAYALLHRGEKLSSVIKRAGGLTNRAFPEGTVFMRNINNISSTNQLETTVGVQDELFREANLDLRADLIKAGAKDADISKITSDVRGDGVTKQMMDRADTVNSNANVEKTNLEKNDFAKALDNNSDDPNQVVKTRIAIPMAEIVSGKIDPEEDIELMAGDEITVPVIPHTVSVLGAVMNPTTIMYTSKGNAAYYINRAGGYTAHCDHKRTVVVRANGEVMRLRNVRRIARGDIILVPPKASIVRKDTLKEVSSIAQILGNLAVTYKVINDTK